MYPAFAKFKHISRFNINTIMRILYFPTSPKFVNFKKEIACLLSFTSAILSWFFILTHEHKVNFHCVLFGVISERDRTFTEGSLSLCFVFVLTEFLMALLSLGLFILSRKKPYHQL